jgi:hypothetical protein
VRDSRPLLDEVQREAAIALTACYLPARKAMSMYPCMALR